MSWFVMVIDIGKKNFNFTNEIGKRQMKDYWQPKKKKNMIWEFWIEVWHWTPSLGLK